MRIQRIFKTVYWRGAIVCLFVVLFIWLYRYLLSAHYSLIYTGAIVLHENREAAEFIQTSYTYGVFATGLVLMIIGAGIMDFVSYVILKRRYRELERTFLSFADGNYSLRIGGDGLKQLGPIADGFNNMADLVVKSMQELKENDRLRRELVANIAHDLGSPITSIRGYAETVLMKESALDSDQRKQLVQTILSNADYLAHLVDELIQLSRLDSAELDVDEVSFSLDEVCARVVSLLQEEAEQKQHRVSIAESIAKFQVLGDPEMIGRVLHNLIGNAIKYTPAEGEIGITAMETDGRVMIRVSDTGVGISEEDLPQVQQRFFRSERHRGRKEGGGLGLGLAISKLIVNAHGSDLVIESKLHEGTTISFSLKNAENSDKNLVSEQ